MAALVARHPDGVVRRVVLCGSARATGRCRAIADSLAQELVAANPADRIITLSIAGMDIHGCIGCNTCRDEGACVFEDDMVRVMATLDEADELHVVSPVYFAGPPSQFKALLDRLQPHFWKNTRALPKRPARLHVVGEGGDPHGFEPLVTICRSALSVAGFALETVTPHIGAASSEEALR